MELLFLLVLVPVVWLLRLPARVSRAVRRHRLAGACALAAVALGGFLLLQLAPPLPPIDYAAGDAALRAMLE